MQVLVESVPCSLRSSTAPPWRHLAVVDRITDLIVCLMSARIMDISSATQLIISFDLISRVEFR